MRLRRWTGGEARGIPVLPWQGFS